MKYRELGRTGLKVSEIGLGGEWLEKQSPEAVKAIIDRCEHHGINILDCWMSNPEVRSNIGAALVGTFVGILLCYGVFGPIAGKMITLAEERSFFFRVIQEAVAAAVRGSSPIIALEYGRRAIPRAFRPTFQEMEQACKGG